MADIKVYGTFKNATKSGKIAYADQIYDADLNKRQSEINATLNSRSMSRIKVVAWNIGLFSLGQYADPSITPATFDEMRAKWRNMINDLSPDIMCCCEYNELFMKAQGGSSAVTAREAVFNPHILHYGEIGPSTVHPAMKTAIFSNFALGTSQAYFFEQSNISGGRYYQVSNVMLNGKSIKLASVHLEYIPANASQSDVERIHNIRLSEINELISFFEDDEYVIIAGDFNVDHSEAFYADYDLFTQAGYNMANHAYLGDILTHPAGEVQTRPLDNIVCKGFAVGEVGIKNDDTLSDHCCIFADLTMLA